MKKIFSLLVFTICISVAMAQSHKMVIHVDKDLGIEHADGKISIPIDNVQEVTFEEITEEVIPSGTTPIIFDFSDYVPATRSQANRAPQLYSRKYGVFACYNDGKAIGQDKVPANFMHNQEIVYEGTKWQYSPQKYWPENEESSNYVSFFAYSPYSGSDGNGFVSVNNESQEPVINYSSSNPMNDAGDLLYGIATNVTKNTNNGSVSIQSKHALSRLTLKGVLKSEDFGSSTKITIGNIKISGQIPNKGSFDLLEQKWKNLPSEVQTYIIDGDNIREDLRDANTGTAGQPEGITYDRKLIAVNPLLLIPANEKIEITITADYYITTDDLSSPTGYVRSQKTNEQKIKLDLTSGWSYDLQIAFGTTSIDVMTQATSSWEDMFDVILGE